MPPRRRGQVTTEDLLLGFADQLQNAATRPNINRFVPLAQQELFLKSQAKNRILFGGNRAGKTEGGVADDVYIMLGKHPYRQHMYADRPLRLRFIGVDFDRGIEQGALPKFAQMLPPSTLINGSWEDSYRASTHMLTLANKATCSFMSYEQDPNKFQIVSLDHVHFDEEPPKPIFDESKMRVLDTAGTWTMTETPVQQLEWVEDELIEHAQPPVGDGTQQIEVFYLNTLENIHLPVEELQDLVAGMNEQEKIVRLAGRYPPGSLVFPEFQRKYPFVISSQFLPRGPKWRISVAMDYGYANPSAWLWIAHHEDGSIVVFRCLYGPNITVKEWGAAVRAMNLQIAHELGYPDTWRPSMYVGDPAIKQKGASAAVSGKTIQQLYGEEGIPIGVEGIVKARTGNQNVGLDRIHQYLRMRPEWMPSASTSERGEPYLQITENCQPLINELRKARKPKQTLKAKENANPSEEIRDKDNHAIDALKYYLILGGDPLLGETGHSPYGAAGRGSVLIPGEEADFDYEALPEDWQRAAATSPTRAGEVGRATLAARNSWSLSGGHSYTDLEG